MTASDKMAAMISFRRSDRPGLTAIVVVAILLAVGCLFVYAGAQAISTRHYESAWEQQGSVTGWGTAVTRGVDRFAGTEAVRVGSGMAALGAMFLLWGLGGTWATIRPAGMELGRASCVMLCAVSMLLQATALVCLAPPWRIGSGMGPALWMTLLLIVIAVWAAATWFEVRHQAQLWSKLLVALAIIAVCATSVIEGRWWIGVGMGVLAAISSIGHYMVLSALLRSPEGVVEASTQRSSQLYLDR